jgi:transcription-repair coupling factor (superfamily II helicase)
MHPGLARRRGERMLPLLRRLQTDPAFEAVLAALREGAPCAQAEGIPTAARPLFLSALQLATQRPLLVLCAGDEQADRRYQSMVHCLGEDRVRLFPSTEMALFERYDTDADTASDRLRVLGELIGGSAGVVVASGSVLLQYLMPRSRYRELTRMVRVNEDSGYEELLRWLSEAGYSRSDLVEAPGEFAARGGILDVYPPTLTEPIRVEFWGDTVESIRRFDPGSQRSVDRIGAVRLVPAGEMVPTAAQRARGADRIEELRRDLPDRLPAERRKHLDEVLRADAEALRIGRRFPGIGYYHQLLFDERETLLDYLAPNTLVALDDPLRMVRACEELLAELAEVHEKRVQRGELVPLPEPALLSAEELTQRLAGRPSVHLTLLSPSIPWVHERRLVTFECASVDSFRGSAKDLCQSVAEWQATGAAIVLSTTQQKRMVQILGEHGVEHTEEYGEDRDLASGMAHVGTLAVEAGFSVLGAKLVVLTDREIFGWHRAMLPARRPRSEVKLTTLAELHTGDHVVHVAHGVGRYVGIVQDTIEGVERDYLRIEYADGVLKVPTTQIDRIQKYIGAEGHMPTIDNIAGTTWSRKRKKAEKATADLAKQLLKLYAEREAAKGHRFSEDQPWQHEVEAAFVYEETGDQLRAISEVKGDMESPQVMDRLVCGDVGFGKTEVAVRAALKCVLDGRQVAVLVPTTILCEQHYRTFDERLGAYPVRIDKLSRFSSTKESRKVFAGIESGASDIVVGTHRLLSQQAKFPNLGLLVIDEEQRFGVKHKEALRMLRANVDVLTMTATPIPRTLHMSLSGIRDLSIIQEAPKGRVAVRTFCVEEEDDVIREAVRRELGREGQVYFVHNRVQSIASWAQRLKRLVPEARIAIAHGQMGDDELEEIMLDFYAGEYDILCCTSIIESGLDVPNVNTLIVQNAPMFGLAQLYQLRGRVGRSTRQAYAYFLYSHPERLTPQAEERLLAIREFSELGSGLRIAMRDLEIRGAGSLLGAEQHGHIEAVGFELYCQMLKEAVGKLRGEAPAASTDDLPAVDMPLDAYLPASYIPNEGQRLDLYRRLSTCRTAERIDEIHAELVDRFGALPEQAAQLVRVLRFRVRCKERGVGAIVEDASALQLRVHPGLKITQAAQIRLRKYGIQHQRRTLRALVVKDLWVSVAFTNIAPAAKLDALEEITDLIATETRTARLAP